MVYNLCLNYLQQREDAEEVTQNVFVKVHEKMGGFSGKSTIKTWIYRITINQCLDHLKARKRQKRFGFHVSLSGTETEGGQTKLELPNFDHPGVLLEDKEALKEVFDSINELPAKQKTAVLLNAVDGLTQQEIADIMKLSIKAVESLLSRGKKYLRSRLG